MFLSNQSSQNLSYYKELLGVVGSLSNLFAESSSPYVSYRVTENLFCKAFQAENLSRSDVSADASKDHVGIGIKTFLEQRKNTIQKIAEFNRQNKLVIGQSPEKIIDVISTLRNERLAVTKRIHALNSLFYHCITRSPGKVYAYDAEMSLIEKDKIRITEVKDSGIKFTDGKNEYTFSRSKSTLYKRFNTPAYEVEVDVNILEDPFEVLEKLFKIGKNKFTFSEIREEKEHVYLPLYSTIGGEMTVAEKSGLNAWNAGGRPRNIGEVYIQIPIFIHQKFPNFFPSQDKDFDLVLPNGETIKASVCQENGKALMSNPNKALGKWILRDVLNLKDGELLTYDKLREIGLDSVVVYKESENKYSINFTKIKSYENFRTKALGIEIV
jgi:hypothetical protein